LSYFVSRPTRTRTHTSNMALDRRTSDPSWHEDDLCEQLASMHVNQGQRSVNPFGVAASVWSPPTPALSKSRRGDSRSQKGGLDYASYAVRSDKRSLYDRRLSEDLDFTHVLGSCTDDDEDSYQASPRSFTALDFLRESNSPLRGRNGQPPHSRRPKWSPKEKLLRKAEPQDLSRSSYSPQIEGRRGFGAGGRNNSASSLSSLNDSPDHVISSCRHHILPQVRGRSNTVTQRHLSISSLRSLQNAKIVENDHERSEHTSLLEHARTQARYLMSRRASEPAWGISPQLGPRMSPSESVTYRGEGQQHLQTSSASNTNLGRFSSSAEHETSSPNPMGPEAYNSFRVIASPGALRTGDQISTPGRDRSASMHHINDELYKTELCANWITTGACSYGSKCNFSHGYEDLRPRKRVENYKSQPCCDPARMGCRRCMYGKRCNYAHPGEALRRPRPAPYFDKDYFTELKQDFPKTQYPFGIYL